MTILLTPQWTFERKLDVLGNIFCQHKSISMLSKENGISVNQIHNWILETLGNDTDLLKKPGYNIIKDKNHLTAGFSKQCMDLGSKRKPEIGLSDYDITPEYADIYIANGQEAMDKKIRCDSSVLAYHDILGWPEFTANIYPIFDEHGESKATFIHSQLIVGLNDMPFNKVIDLIYKGYGYIFVKKSSYTLVIDGQIIKFNQRQALCLVYLLIGIKNSHIAQLMQTSLKNVERMITEFNQMCGTSSASECIEICLKNHFFTQF